MMYTAQADIAIKSGINYFHKSFYYLYILVVIITFSPSKLIAYFTPFFLLIGLMLIWPSDKMFRKILACLLFAGILISFYGLIYPYMVVQNALLILLTYSSFIPIIVIPSRMLVSEILFHKILAFNQKLLLLEGIVGIIQGLYAFSKSRTFSGGTGDAVGGTLHLSLDSDGSFANPMFVVNMAFLCLLALVAVVRFRYKPYPLIIGVLSIFLASVIHVVMFLIAAALIITFINFYHLLKKPKFFITFLICIALLFSAIIHLQGINGAQVSEQGNLDPSKDMVPKTKITYEVLNVIPKEYPAMPYIGLGPGQFSSRASLIGSGHYFGNFYKPKPVPLLTPKTSAPMEKFLMPLWAWSAKPFLNLGSSEKPYYSWLSIYSEFGLVGSIIVIMIFAFLLIKAKSVRINPQKFLDNFIFQVGVLFLFLLGYQETYWETSQAIFIGLILLKLLYANLFYSDIDIRKNMAK